ncbi:hypothetical protein KCTC32516_00805 [Polaribacter huanghezhanensis]|uniref:hypothetical protein n=1 Tax=Polaribacter huanghezhanensis TaxID=1354726 RepID=UPI0026481ABA|nr:hypothetical protein [Polaribacter huanghezhanensis]WKD85464.1 hypothetical protein KCTC32516_00805 [Polaribacter huanghezhanensis]
MKYLLFTIALFLCANITAQELPKKSKIFVRVYNNEGQKIAKGKMLKITDDTLFLKKGSKSVTVPLSDIMYIKTKRTNKHNVLIGGLFGVGYGLFGLTQSNGSKFDTVGFVVLTPLFAAFGSGIGYLTTLFKKSTHYSIQSDAIKWQAFKDAMYAPQ